MQLRGGLLGVDRPLPVDVPAGHRNVRGIVNEDLTFFEVEQRLSVCLGKMPGSEHPLRRARCNHATRQQQHVVGDPRLGQIMGRHHDGATT